MRLAVIPGDGIGPEVIAQAMRVLKELVPDVQSTEFDFGASRYFATGEVLTSADLQALQEHDAILLGAIGDPRVPSGVLERGFLLALRFACDHHLNLRPAKTYPGVPTPLAQNPPIDFVVFREGTEGPYAGVGGTVRTGTPHEIATETSVNTRFGIDRVVEQAFKAAQDRKKKLTLVHKTNVLTYSGALWLQSVEAFSAHYPQVQVDYAHIDAATIYMVTDPSRFDVIVTDNLFGDIITDLAAAITGGIGLAASANIDSSRTYPSMFEPVHGSAPDIAGKDLADPIAAIQSVSLLCNHMGYTDAAHRIEAAVAQELVSRTPGQKISTTDVGNRVVQSLSSLG